MGTAHTLLGQLKGRLLLLGSLSTWSPQVPRSGVFKGHQSPGVTSMTILSSLRCAVCLLQDGRDATAQRPTFCTLNFQSWWGCAALREGIQLVCVIVDCVPLHKQCASELANNQRHNVKTTPQNVTRMHLKYSPCCVRDCMRMDHDNLKFWSTRAGKGTQENYPAVNRLQR